jgi:hypothetical protein
MSWAELRLDTRERESTAVLIYRGPSRIDGSPIIALLTGVDRKSRNSKTAGMAQLYILPENISPTDAVRNGRDRGVCGSCMHRGTPGTRRRKPRHRTCYVVVAQGPTAAWATYQRGGHPWMHPIEANAILQCKQLAVRLGAYGEPGALPVHVLQQLTYHVEHTGYTHMWPQLGADYRALLMASVDVPSDHPRAQAAGWRTFRVRLQDEPIAAREITCPASAEAGHHTTCDRCVLCSGASDSIKSITIQIHGSRGAAERFIQARRVAA